MAVLIVIGEDGNLGKSGVIQSFAQKSPIVGQTAVAHIFPHGHRRTFYIILTASQRGEDLSDDDLCRKTDIIVHVFFSHADGFLPSDGQRHRPDPLSRHGRRHQPAECMGRIGNQNNLILPVLFFKFDRIRIARTFHRKALAPFPSHGHRLQKGTDPDTQRALDIAFIHL